MTSSPSRFLVMLATFCVPVSPLMAQISTQSERTALNAISVTQRDAVIAAVESEIRRDYVFPDKTAAIIDALENSRQMGRYDIKDATRLGQLISEDLGVASKDHHLSLNYDPVRYEVAMRPATPGDAEGDLYDRQMSLRDNSGLAEMRILPGNIRYLKIARFGWIPDETGAAYDDAMRFMHGGDALIIDLRGNPGGDGAAVRYLVSHFLDPNTLELSFLEGTKQPVQMRALDNLPAGRLKGKPLFVLIDGNVASAGESFAYDVEYFKLGTLIGSKTIGAANNNKYLPIAPGYMLSVSYGRPVHAVSGTNWEGVGVLPSVETTSADALKIAERVALLRLKSENSASPENVADYDWALVGVESRLHPVILSPDQIQSLVGQYGEVGVELSGGKLSMTRTGRPARTLTPLTADGLLAVDGIDMMRVRITPNVLETYWKGDPTPRSYPRKRN